MNPEGSVDDDSDSNGGMPEDQEDDCPKPTDVLRQPQENLPE